MDLEPDQIPTIDPHFQELYKWEMKQENPSTVVVLIDYPTDFNPNSIQYELNEEKTTFTAEFPGNPPFIQGELYEPVDGFTTEIVENQIKLVFTKSTETEWPYLIKGHIPGTQDIDPNSAFDIFIHLSRTLVDNDSAEKRDFLEGLLALSMMRGYTPALNYGIEMMESEEDSQERRIALLQLAALKYGDPVAIFKYATFLVSVGESEKGFKLLSIAAQHGIGMAISLMGQMVSPLSGVEFVEKDPVAAMQLFEKVISVKDEPVALYEAAKLLKAGLGCERDVAKAEDYYRRAKAVEPKLPELPDYPDPDSGNRIFGIPIFAAAGLAVAAVGIGTFISMLFKKHRN